MQKIVVGLAGTALALVCVYGGYVAGRGVTEPETTPAAATGRSATTDRAQVESIVHAYLLENPNILLEVQAALTQQSQEQQKQQQLAVVQAEHGAIYESPFDGAIGNPEATTTVVEFFDHNCGYCKHALADMQELVQSHPDIRFVLKEFPILGPESQQAHVVAAALKRVAPDKYAEFHIRLLGGSGRADEAVAIRVATDLGVDEAALREGMKDPSIMEEFAKTYELANKLAITGTPSYVIGNEVLFGAVGASDIANAIQSTSATN